VERGGGVVGGLARLVWNHPVGGFEREGVIPDGHQGGKKIQDDHGVDKVDPFAYGIGDPIGAGGREAGGFGHGVRNLVLGRRDS